MADQQQLDHDSPAVHKHLEILQGIISRMADNSRSCKVWCSTLVSAVLIFTVRTERVDYAFMALVPAVALLVLDAYYVAHERAFRKSHESFVCRLHDGTLTPKELFVFGRLGSLPKRVASSFGSFSVLPFYIAIFAMVLLVWWVTKQ